MRVSTHTAIRAKGKNIKPTPIIVETVKDARFAILFFSPPAAAAAPPVPAAAVCSSSSFGFSSSSSSFLFLFFSFLSFFFFFFLSSSCFSKVFFLASRFRSLHILLFDAERAWAYAMQLKEEVVLDPRKRDHMVARMKRAADLATKLEELAKTLCDERTSKDISVSDLSFFFFIFFFFLFRFR